MINSNNVTYLFIHEHVRGAITMFLDNLNNNWKLQINHNFSYSFLK